MKYLTWGLTALGVGLFITPAFLMVNGESVEQFFKADALAQSSGQSGSQSTPIPTPTASPETTPQRLTITVSVSAPDDLKVKERQDLQRGDIIADRSRERARLESQKQQLNLALLRLKSSTISKPLSPAMSPAIAPLPTPSYLEEQAAIARAQASVSQMEHTISLKRQEIQYLQGLPNLDPLVLEHETAKLAELQQQHTAVVRDYQLAVGKLATAQEAQQRTDYERSIALAQQADSRNRDALEYQQQMAQYEQRLRDRDYQVSQTQVKLEEVNNAIATLAVVRSPYGGRVRRIKALGQGPDGSLSFEITLLVNARDGGGAALSGQ